MSRKDKIILVTMILIGLCIFGYSLKNISLYMIILDLKKMKWGWLLISFFSMLISLICEAYIVRYLLLRYYPDFTWYNAIRIPMIEQLFNGITPFSSGGQPAQIVALVQSGVEGGRATSILLMKFIIYQSMIVFSFIICMIFGFNLIVSKIYVMGFLLIFGFLIHFSVIVGLLMLMYWNKFTRKLINISLYPLKLFKFNLYLKLSKKLNYKITNFYKESLNLKNDKKIIAKVSFITLIQLLFYYIIPYFILLSLGISNVNIFEIMTLHVLIIMVISLFPVPGGVGGAAFSFDAIFSLYIHSHSKLVLAMILWRIVTYYFGIFLGIIAIIKKPHKVKPVNF